MLFPDQSERCVCDLAVRVRLFFELLTKICEQYHIRHLKQFRGY